MVDDVDPFDSLLNIEEEFYEEGYQQGYQDGLRQSRLEARLFGIEKGFEKFIIMGKLQAKAVIWVARSKQEDISNKNSSEKDVSAHSTESGASAQLQPFPYNPRLEKHIQTLVALVNPSTLSTANTDDAVAEFDDRLKRAQAKEKVIERIIGETTANASNESRISHQITRTNDDFENFGIK